MTTTGQERRKVYLAARYDRQAEMRAAREDLRALGHAVTSRWIDDPGASFTAARLASDPGYWGAVARQAAQDTAAADTVISFTSADGGGRGGRHVEFGIGLALGKRLVVIGPPEHLFHVLPQVEHHPDWAHLVTAWAKEAAS